jgi:Ca2+-transporting ATPase
MQVSTGLGAGIPEQRAKNEWIEGVAIWVAVFLVSGIGTPPSNSRPPHHPV